MSNKLLILIIAMVASLICIAPMAAAENNVVSDFVLLDFNPFGNSNEVPFEINDLKILKVNKEHTKSDGEVKKSTNFYLKFNVKPTSDSIDSYKVKIDCLDKKNKSIKTVDSSIDHDGNYNIPLEDASKVKGANITVYNENGDVILTKFTSNVKVDKKVTKDKPAEEKSSSSSGATYWASSKSGKFHNPSCEWAQKISSKNKVVFHSREEALNSGYQPCQVCSP